MTKLLKKHIMSGGDNFGTIEYKQLQNFFSIIIIGYFGIKIIYPLFFKFYPEKYYYKNVQITTNEGEHTNITKDIIIQSYMPGLWNNEITDFITLIVIVFIVYVFTNGTNKIISEQSNSINIYFLIGYILGLGYPPLYVNYQNYINNSSQTNNISKYIVFIFLIGLIINIITINYIESEKISTTAKTNYIIYICVFILLIFGLIGTRKLSQNYNTVTYFNNNGDNCTFSKNGVIQTSGDTINITLPFIAFIIILLFSYEPTAISIQNYYIFIYGLLLGIIVSGISYFGLEYFLNKIPQKECNNVNECLIKGMPIPSEENTQTINSEEITYSNQEIKNVDQNLKSTFDFNKKIPTFNIILFIFILLLIVYLVYYYMTNK